MLDRVGTDGLDADGVSAIQQVIVDTGALAELEATIDRLADAAVDALDRDRPRPPARAAELAALADYVVGREG